MIAVDTNVLIRYLVRDDEEQAAAAQALLERLTPDQPGFICREVVLEVVWVLERAYRLPRKQIADVLVELMATDSLVVEMADDVARASFRYTQGGPNFSDLLICAAAERAGARPLYTFDRKLVQEEGATLVEKVQP